MPWVRFSADFDWPVPERNGQALIAYRTGMVKLVRKACAEQAIAAGKAARAARPTGGKGS